MNNVKKDTETIGNLVSKMGDKVGSLGVRVEDLTNIQGVLGRMAVDAKDKYVGEMQMYFLWDNNDLLQMMDNLMFRLMTEINEEYKQINEMQRLLHELTSTKGLKGGVENG